jgi:hypothetical protein
MAAKKKMTPAKKDVQPKPRLNESKKAPAKKTPEQVKAKKYVEKGRAAKNKAGDLASERTAVRKAESINRVDRARQKANPSSKGIFGYVTRNEKGTLVPRWDNYKWTDGTTGRPPLPMVFDRYKNAKKKK